jgi:DNA polymerase
VYRADNQMVKNYWSLGSEAITAMYRGEEFEFGGPEGNLLRTEQGAIVLPNGLRLLYPEIEYKDREFTCLRKKEGRVQRVKLYGGAIVENVTQALARIVISDNMLNIDRHGYKVVLQVHDEVVLLVREEEAEEAYSNTIGWMRTAPAWATGLPLDAEGGIADRYGDAK